MTLSYYSSNIPEIKISFTEQDDERRAEDILYQRTSVIEKGKFETNAIMMH